LALVIQNKHIIGDADIGLDYHVIRNGVRTAVPFERSVLFGCSVRCRPFAPSNIPEGRLLGLNTVGDRPGGGDSLVMHYMRSLD
jgi:hypothetical protein